MSIMKSKTSDTSCVDKENSLSTSSNINFSPRHRMKQKQKVQSQQEPDPTFSSKSSSEMVSSNISLSARLESIEQKLLQLHSLKEDTISEVEDLINEQLIPLMEDIKCRGYQDQDFIDESNVSKARMNESGLLRLLHRLNTLQSDYRNRRSVSLQRLNFRMSTAQEQYNAKSLQYNTEAETDQAETAVALIHKYKNLESKENAPKTGSFSSSISISGSNYSLNDSSSADKIKINHLNTPSSKASFIASRKRSLPAINHLPSSYPLAMKMSRRKSVTAYLGDSVNCNDVSKNLPTSLPLPQNIAEADLMSIKSHIYNSFNK